MPSVFLSYAREDLDSARKIGLILEDAGHSVWWDRRIKGGAQYSKAIDKALAAADLIVVLWSADCVRRYFGFAVESSPVCNTRSVQRRRITIPDLKGRPGFSPEQRQTRLLFEPVTRPLRSDPRFDPLVRDLGLERYWRQSGAPPDYRLS